MGAQPSLHDLLQNVLVHTVGRWQPPWVFVGMGERPVQGMEPSAKASTSVALSSFFYFL